MTMLYSLALKHRLYGLAAARRAVTFTFFSFTLILGAIVILDTRMADPLHQISARMIASGFISFWLVQSLMLYLLERHADRPPLIAMPLTLLATQVAACMIFFPGAFLGLFPAETVLEFAILGTLTRSAIVIMAVPFLAFSLRDFRRHGRVFFGGETRDPLNPRRGTGGPVHAGQE